MRSKLLLAAFAAATLSGAAGAQTVTNGSFEAPVATPGNGQFDTFGNDSTGITGWTVTGNSVDRVFSTL